MRSHEERIVEVKRRIAEKERQQKQRRGIIAAVSGIAACLVIIIGAALAMPGIIEQTRPDTSGGYATAAAMLAGNTALGYIVIGLLAFVLGVCVTVLCCRIRLLHRDEHAEEDSHGTRQ